MCPQYSSALPRPLRLQGLKAQCRSYSGPLVAALYVPLLINATAEETGGQKLGEAGGDVAAATVASAPRAVGQAGVGVFGVVGGTAGEQQQEAQSDAAVIAGATAGAAVDPDGEKSDLYGGRGASGEDGEEAYEEAEAGRAAGAADVGTGVGIGAAEGDPILDNLKKRARQALGVGVGGVEGSVWASGEVGLEMGAERRRGRRLRQGQLPQAQGGQQGQGVQTQVTGVQQEHVSQGQGQAHGVTQPGVQVDPQAQGQQQQEQQQAGAAPSFPAPEEVLDAGHAVPGGALGADQLAMLEGALRSAREVMQVCTDAVRVTVVSRRCARMG